MSCGFLYVDMKCRGGSVVCDDAWNGSVCRIAAAIRLLCHAGTVWQSVVWCVAWCTSYVIACVCAGITFDLSCVSCHLHAMVVHLTPRLITKGRV